MEHIGELEWSDRRAGDGGVIVAALAASILTLLISGVIALLLF